MAGRWHVKVISESIILMNVYFNIRINKFDCVRKSALTLFAITMYSFDIVDGIAEMLKYIHQ